MCEQMRKVMRILKVFCAFLGFFSGVLECANRNSPAQFLRIFFTGKSLANYSTNHLCSRCTYCSAAVEEDESAGPQRDSRQMLARFNTQMEKLVSS